MDYDIGKAEIDLEASSSSQFPLVRDPEDKEFVVLSRINSPSSAPNSPQSGGKGSRKSLMSTQQYDDRIEYVGVNNGSGPSAVAGVTVGPSSSSNSSSSSSPTKSTRVDDEESKGGLFSCPRFVTIDPEADKRLAASHMSFILGRLLALGGSTGLLVGLLIKFMFLDGNPTMAIISYIIIAGSLFSFVVGAILVIYATVFKSTRFRQEWERERFPPPGCPPSTISSGSFPGSSTSTNLKKKGLTKDPSQARTPIKAGIMST